VYERGDVEFSRVLAFSDGVFAIAMTLLVVGIEVPDLADKESVGDLADALGDLSPSLISFFISFAVIGRYWLAHHAFVAMLARMDMRLVGMNLVYLAFIAFLPFPTALLGNFFDNPLTIAVYAASVAAVSGMEVVLFRIAYRDKLMARPMTPEVYRWETLMSASPVVLFTLSIPVAFAVGSGWAVFVWFLGMPLGMLTSRWKPEGADDLLM
jgi:uncharacterized membrane protein